MCNWAAAGMYTVINANGGSGSRDSSYAGIAALGAHMLVRKFQDVVANSKEPTEAPCTARH